MRSVKHWRLLVVLTVLSVFALAQTVPNLPGFPSNSGSAAGGSSSGFWYDAGAGYIQADERLTHQTTDSPIVAASNNNTSTVSNGLVVQARNFVAGFNISPALAFQGPGSNPSSTSANWGGIYTSQVSSGAMVSGMNFVTNNSGGVLNFAWASGDTYSSLGAGTLYMMLDTNRTLKNYATAGNSAFAVVTTGALIDVGAGGSDHLVSDGTGVTTPSYLQGTTGLCTGSACAGTSFASFPAAAGGNQGRILVDSTNNVPRYSNGSAWQTIAYEVKFTGFFPLGVATGATVGIQEQKMYNPGKVVDINVFPLAAGTGGGNYVVRVYNNTAAAAMCTVTVGPCTSVGSASATTGCTGAVAKNDILRLEVDSTGCTTSPAFNVSATIIGG